MDSGVGGGSPSGIVDSRVGGGSPSSIVDSGVGVIGGKVGGHGISGDRVGGGRVASHRVGSCRVGRVMDGSIASNAASVSVPHMFGGSRFLSPHPEFLLSLFFGKGKRPSGESLRLDGTVDFPIAIFTT